jgi:hypothetical protein
MSNVQDHPMLPDRTAPDNAHARAVSQPTPQATVEAVMWAVRRRGLLALREPANQQRLLDCDTPARAQINERIDRLITAGRIPGEVKVNG